MESCRKFEARSDSESENDFDDIRSAARIQVRKMIDKIIRNQ